VPDSLCLVVPVAAGQGVGGFGIFSYRADEWPLQQRFYAAELDLLRTVEAPLATLGRDLVTHALADLHVSRDLVAIGDMYFLALLEPSGQVRVLPPLPGFSDAVVQAPITLIGPDLFWHDSTSYVRVAHATPDSDTELFLEVEGGADVRNFVSDGYDMAWYAAYYAPNRYDYERIELWTASHTTDPSRLAPRKVGDLDSTTYYLGTVGDGYFAYERRVGDGRPIQFEVVVYRLSDGKRTFVRYPEDAFVHALYVADGAVVAYSNGPGHARLFRSYLDGAVFE
jgi:hypothetical protein